MSNFQILTETQGSVTEIQTSVEGEMLTGEFRIYASNGSYGMSYDYRGREERTQALRCALNDFVLNVL